MDILRGHARDLGGGLQVSRVLPGHPHRMVGPFIFFDRMGPAEIAAGQDVDVRPHPHIGLATVTWLFEGGLVHRDSLGVVQPIAPGELNWMTAGSGIVHSERQAPEVKSRPHRMAGIQSWVAMPREAENAAPSFSHHPAAALPRIRAKGAGLTLIAGEAWGERAPVPTFSPMFYAAGELQTGAEVALPEEHEERAVYLLEGEVAVAGRPLPAGSLAVLAPGEPAQLRAASDARVMLLGGARMDGPRHIWWNFVSSSREAIEAAKARWRERRFPAVPGDDDFIPLPER